MKSCDIKQKHKTEISMIKHVVWWKAWCLIFTNVKINLNRPKTARGLHSWESQHFKCKSDSLSTVNRSTGWRGDGCFLCSLTLHHSHSPSSSNSEKKILSWLDWIHGSGHRSVSKGVTIAENLEKALNKINKRRKITFVQTERKII